MTSRLTLPGTPAKDTLGRDRTDRAILGLGAACRAIARRR